MAFLQSFKYLNTLQTYSSCIKWNDISCSQQVYLIKQIYTRYYNKQMFSIWLYIIFKIKGSLPAEIGYAYYAYKYKIDGNKTF